MSAVTSSDQEGIPTGQRLNKAATRGAAQRRSYGSGTLYERLDAQGRWWWYGRWHSGRSRPNRKIGLVRKRGHDEGLTKTEAGRKLQKLIDAEQPKPRGAEVVLAAAGDHLLLHLEAKGRKPTTLATYESTLRTHLKVPPLGERLIHQVGPEDVEELLARMRREGKAPKTIANTFKLLHQIFVFGKRRRWCNENPCELVDPPVVERSKDIRYLDTTELAALLRSVDINQEPYGSTDRALYLTAALTGLRQGELLALRWRDVDWGASKIRVRRNYVRGHWLTPKSRRGSRTVPLADQVAGELDRHFKRSLFQSDDDLAFAHPEKGTVLEHTALVKRFKHALKLADLRPVRFHDLRHTFGTRLAASGVVPRTLQEWMGHADLDTTLIYLDYSPQKNESQIVAKAFSEVVPGELLTA